MKKDTQQQTLEPFNCKPEIRRPLCLSRFVAELRRIANELEVYDREQRDKEAQMREILGIPRSVSPIK